MFSIGNLLQYNDNDRLKIKGWKMSMQVPNKIKIKRLH